MDAEKEIDSSKSAPSHCKTEREEPSIKNAAEAEGSKNESEAEADGVSQAADEAECVLEAEAIETSEVSGEGGIKVTTQSKLKKEAAREALMRTARTTSPFSARRRRSRMRIAARSAGPHSKAMRRSAPSAAPPPPPPLLRVRAS